MKSGLFPQMDGLSLQSPLRFLSVLVICLLLTKHCKGQSQVIGPPQPIVATVGDNIILPCHLEPAADVAAMILEWTRPDLESTFAFVWRAEREVTKTISPSYKGRTSLFTDELKQGNISLKVSDVRPSDAGRYRCYIPDMLKESFIELVVGAVSLPVITSVEIDRDKGGVMLQCECAGWYPEPEVLWLDGEGKLLSAGPTETVRGPDDLYTVSSRVTVEKRHSNSFTCRVQQRNINQTRETHIQVPADFLMVQAPSSNDTTGLTVGLAVCIAVILILLFFVWKLRQNQNETSRGFPDENKAEETMRLMTVQKMSRDSEEDENKYLKQLQVEQQRRENAEDTVKTLKQKLEVNHVELQKLKEENEQLKNKPTLKEEVESQKEEFMENQDDTSKQLQDEQKEVESKNKELEAKLDETMTQLQDEQRRREEAESKNKELEDELAKTTNQLQDEEQKRKDAEKEVENLKTELKNVKQANDRCKEELAETQTKLDKRNAEIRDLKKKEEDKFKRQLGRKDSGKPLIPEKKLRNKNREEEEQKKGDEEAQKDDATFKTLEDLESKNKDEQQTEGGAEKEVETQAEVGTSEEKVSKPEKPETECDTSEEKLEATTDSKEQ